MSVDAWFAALEHHHAETLLGLRRIILDADPRITEAIKWNVPSFRTTEFFATLHVRAKTGVGVILHFGAKKGGGVGARQSIQDPAGLLTWLAEDRATVAVADAKQLTAIEAPLGALIREWIAFV